MDRNSGAVEAEKEEEKAIHERNKLLKQAYDDQLKETELAQNEGKLGQHHAFSDKETCDPSSTMVSHTSSVTMLDRHPFGDKHYVKMRWIDTPGRGDTRGEENAAWQRGVAMREMMLKELRRSFGYHLYEHLDLVFNFLPHLPNKSEYRESVLLPQREKFTNWIMEQENKLFNWSSELRKNVSAQVNRTGFYGISINPTYLADCPLDLPLSAPYLRQFPPFSYPAGVDELIKMYESARHCYVNSSGLKVADKHPRIGPGVLQNFSSLRYECGLRPKWSWKDGYQENQYRQRLHRRLLLTPGYVAVHVTMRGALFSAGDRAFLLSSRDGENVECGDPEEKGWPRDWANQTVKAVSRSATGEWATYRFDWRPGSLQVCFCEAPNCTESWRFGQNLSLPEASSGNCKEEDLVSTFQSPNLTSRGWLRPVAVNNRLFAIASDDNVVSVNLQHNAPYSAHRISLGQNKPSYYRFVAELNGSIYVVGSDILIWNTATQKTSKIPLPVFKRSFMAAANHSLYILSHGDPGQTYLIVFDVVSIAINWVDISQAHHLLAQTNTVSDYELFGGCVVVSNELFVLPRSAPGVLVIDLASFNMSTLSTETVQTGSYKWSEGVEARGRVYAAPANADRILVINAKAPTRDVFGIPTSKVATGRWKWYSLVLANDRLYGVPDFADAALVFDLNTEELYGIEVRLARRVAVVGDRMFWTRWDSSDSFALLSLDATATWLLL